MKKGKSCYSSYGKLGTIKDFPYITHRKFPIDYREITKVSDDNTKIILKRLIHLKRPMNQDNAFSSRNTEKKIENLQHLKVCQTTEPKIFGQEGIIKLPNTNNTLKSIKANQLDFRLKKKVMLNSKLNGLNNKSTRAREDKLPSFNKIKVNFPLLGKNTENLNKSSQAKLKCNQAQRKEGFSVMTVESERDRLLHNLNQLRGKRIKSIYRKILSGVGEESALKLFSEHFIGMDDLINTKEEITTVKKIKVSKSLKQLGPRLLSAKDKTKRIKQYGRWYIDPELYEERLKLKFNYN